jgi:hypothetical protein
MQGLVSLGRFCCTRTVKRIMSKRANIGIIIAVVAGMQAMALVIAPPSESRGGGHGGGYRGGGYGGGGYRGGGYGGGYLGGVGYGGGYYGGGYYGGGFYGSGLNYGYPAYYGSAYNNYDYRGYGAYPYYGEDADYGPPPGGIVRVLISSPHGHIYD